MVRHVKTASEVVEVLGGVAEVCRLTRCKNIKIVYHWTGGAQKFPARTYDVMQRALRQKKATAPAWLWNMIGATKDA